MTGLHARLLSLRDPAYRQFQCRLMPTVDPERVIGVRVPELRRLARQLTTEEAAAFLHTLPHQSYEEDMLHSILLSQMRDHEDVISALDAFLSYVDNWSTCDTISPRAFASRPEGLLPKVQQWMASDHPYTARYGIGVLMRFYLEEGFDPEHLRWMERFPGGAYYVDMMVAWYLATALAKQYRPTLAFLQQHTLPVWTHNKTIQKAIESDRLTPEQKALLRTLKRREPK